MTENASFEALQAQIQQVIDADTDDFFELAALLGRDPLRDLAGANLSGTDLHNGNLAGADLRRTVLQEANLSGANLSGADLSQADLQGANLREASLSNANLLNANLDRADLSRADLSNTRLKGTTLNQTIVQEARFNKNLGLSADLRKDLKRHGALVNAVEDFKEISFHTTGDSSRKSPQEVKEFRERLNALDLEPIAWKLLYSSRSKGWSFEKVLAAIADYKRFLLAQYLNPDRELVLTDDVDYVWHCHILDTQKYTDDCQFLFRNVFYDVSEEGQEGLGLAELKLTEFLSLSSLRKMAQAA